jgi:integrase
LVIAALAGLRTSELSRLNWGDILFDREQIRVNTPLTPRLVPILGKLGSWLRSSHYKIGPIAGRMDIEAEMSWLGTAIGVTDLPLNLRLSFATYRTVVNGDWAKTAIELGENALLLKLSCPASVSKIDAQEWFGITPASLRA